MKVEEHISDLLVEHDCVIVPELGGFVGNYASATIHPVRHTFSPPSKRIIFNRQLKTNDGLLANHLVVQEHVSYPQALQHIQHFVDNVQAQIKKGVKVKIDRVGTLYLDIERNIQFEPSDYNFLPEAFGLDQFRSPAIRQEKIAKRIEKEFRDREALPSGKRKINVKRIVALTLLVPFAAALIWLPIQTGLFKHVSYSDINPFAQEIVQPQKDEVKMRSNELPATTTSSNQQNAVLPDTVATTVVSVVPDTTAVAVQSEVPSDTGYHLVAGCFQVEQNAEKFVDMLREQQLNASIIGKNDRGLYVVSCGDFTTRQAALSELGNLRKVQPSAWLYRN